MQSIAKQLTVVISVGWSYKCSLNLLFFFWNKCILVLQLECYFGKSLLFWDVNSVWFLLQQGTITSEKEAVLPPGGRT